MSTVSASSAGDDSIIDNGGGGSVNGSSDDGVVVYTLKRARIRVIVPAILAIASLGIGFYIPNPLVILMFFPFGYVSAREIDNLKSGYRLDLNEVERNYECVVLRKNTYDDYSGDTIDENVLYERTVKRNHGDLKRDAIARGDHVVKINGRLSWITRDDYDRYGESSPECYEGGIGLGGLIEPPVSHTSMITAGDSNDHDVIRPWTTSLKNGLTDVLPILKDGKVHMVRFKIRTSGSGDADALGDGMQLADMIIVDDQYADKVHSFEDKISLVNGKDEQPEYV
jgi:hypothetical protein